jgi:hypothetical protein
MSLGDQLRFLRAMKDGPSTRDVADAIGLERTTTLREIEQRYREVGDDALLEKLAVYFDVPVENLKWHRARYRKALSHFLEEAEQQGKRVHLNLRSGEVLAGRVTWWDLGAVGLQPDMGELLVVQRHAVVDWGPPESPGGEGSVEQETAA